MSDIPTPRTDDEARLMSLDCDDSCVEIYIKRDGKTIEGDFVSADFARQLERELAESQDRIDDLTATGIHSCGDQCRRPNCELRKELAEATKQRDALAVALRELMFDCLRFRIEPSDDAYENAESALATLEARGSNPAQKSPPTIP